MATKSCGNPARRDPSLGYGRRLAGTARRCTASCGLLCPVTVSRVNRGRPGVLPASEYMASWARKRRAAAALFGDGRGGVLLVDPVYRDTQDPPAGGGGYLKVTNVAAGQRPGPHLRHLRHAR